MATTKVMTETSRVGRWAMRVEPAERTTAGDDRWSARSHALAAWLLDEWKREQAGREAGR
jgi:hypothetical protein